MWNKVIIGFAWWLLPYLFLIMLDLPFWAFFTLYFIQGMGQIFITFNVAHDANHGAISTNRKVNKLLAYAYDICGVNSYLWKILHHQGHHNCLNVHGEDTSIVARGFFRFAPDEPVRPIHRFQHRYAWLFYGLYTMDYVLYKDFKYFFFEPNMHTKNIKHPLKEYVILFAGKLFYIGYMIILPIWLLDFHWLLIIASFFATHFVMGLIMTLTFQTTHAIESTSYPTSKNQYDNYVYHIFATTADYARENKVANWLLGGLNIHIIHHLNATICHVHYPALAKIIKRTAEEYGIEYRENKTIRGALKAHFNLLEYLGKNNPEEWEYPVVRT